MKGKGIAISRQRKEEEIRKNKTPTEEKEGYGNKVKKKTINNDPVHDKKGKRIRNKAERH